MDDSMPKQNLRTVDLHTHSTASDGTLRPSDVIRVGSERGLGVIALTDHDTTDGCTEAAHAASLYSIKFVNGIEVSAYHDGAEHHILGYFVDLGDEPLLRYEGSMRNHRLQRVDEIVARLGRSGIHLTSEHVASENAVPTRLNLARALVAQGHVPDVPSAFEEFLSPGCPAYVPAAMIDARAAIELIHGSGGLSSLAHPGDWTNERDIRELARWGLDAIEVVHPSHDDRLVSYYGRLADTLGLLKTGGSDFHSLDAEPRTGLGSCEIPESWYIKLCERNR